MKKKQTKTKTLSQAFNFCMSISNLNNQLITAALQGTWSHKMRTFLCPQQTEDTGKEQTGLVSMCIFLILSQDYFQTNTL